MTPGTANPPPHGRPLCLVGPTAVGKTEVALLLAERIGAEIISADSMQVYRGLEIGTAKPTPAERRRVPHHLLDVVEVKEPFDAARYASLAQAAVLDIQQRGKIPLFCGGTGLYLKACLQGLGDTPPASPGLRTELEQTPLPELLRELAERDPATYQRIDRHNPRRVIRALEVIRLTGRPYSVQRAAWSAATGGPVPFFGLKRSREDLWARIDARVERMFERGLVAETKQMLERGLGENRTAMQALGYRQVVEYLRGERTLASTIELVKVRTRQFAKRQMTWFRLQAETRWFEVQPGSPAAAVVDQLAEAWSRI